MQSITPITIIGGYLGSGKTTLINHLLRNANGVRLAVLVNDFGELPIDADLIEAQEGDVISLSGGCVCCSYGDDLSLSLQKLQTQDSPPEHIFIEASGVALPGAIGQSLSLLRAYQLEGIVVLADTTSVQEASIQKYIGDTIQRQLYDADLIVLNKVDLLSNSQAKAVRQWINQHYAQAPVIESRFSKIEPEILFELKRDAASSRLDLHAGHTHDVAALFSSVKLNIEQLVDACDLAEKLADKQCGLVRAKGFVLDHDNAFKTIQVVGRRWSVTDAPAGIEPGVVCIAASQSLSEAHIRSVCGL